MCPSCVSRFLWQPIPSNSNHPIPPPIWQPSVNHLARPSLPQRLPPRLLLHVYILQPLAAPRPTLPCSVQPVYCAYRREVYSPSYISVPSQTARGPGRRLIARIVCTGADRQTRHTSSILYLHRPATRHNSFLATLSSLTRLHIISNHFPTFTPSHHLSKRLAACQCCR